MNKLIYIDDNFDSLELYKDILSDHFEVSTFSCPKLALEVARHNSFSAILIDIYLAEVTGFEVINKMKLFPHMSATPFFIISSENTLENRLKAFDMGSEDFINRYMSPKEVIARMTKNLPAGPFAKSPLLRVGDIKLDPSNLTVKCKDKYMPLTQIEYKIIYILLKRYIINPSSIMAKDELIKFVWPIDSHNVFPRTLSTHLTNLRKKLSSDEVKISSIRQNGFRLKIL